MFAVANREIVSISFDPFSISNPAYALRLPMFILIFLLTILGVVIGGFAAWLRQRKWRRSARTAEAENRVLRERLDAMSPRIGHYERDSMPAAAEQPPPMIVPPAA